MRRLPRASAPDVVRALERAGFVRVRVRGSHWVFRHAEHGRRVTVSYHRARIIPPGTMANIVREAGLTVEQFERLLKGQE